MKLIIHTGTNGPGFPILPHFGSNLSYQFRIGPEWFDGHLTEPDHYGLKLPAIGYFNYHKFGINSAIIDGGVWIFRYYFNGQLNQFDEFEIQLEPDRWYRVVQSTKPLAWWFDGKLVHSENMNISGCWMTPPYLGKKKVAVASRDLKIEIEKI